MTRTLSSVIAAAMVATGHEATEATVAGMLGAAATVAATPRASAAERAAMRRRIEAAGEPIARGLEASIAAPPRRRAPAVVQRPTEAQLGARGGARGLDWASEDYAAARSIEASMRAAQRALAELPREYARRVERAALGMVRDAAGMLVPTRAWAHVLARRVVACAVVAWRASGMARRHGMARRVVGRDRGAWARLFVNRTTGQPLSANALYHGGKGGKGWACGAMTALHRAGAWWCHQPPASEADYVGRGRGGEPRALAVYWLSCAALAAPLARELAQLALVSSPAAPPSPCAAAPP